MEIQNHYNVIVVGGGPTGIGAALAASRQGMKTLVIEQLNSFGGIGGAGGHGYMCICNDWDSDNQIVGGVAYELLDRIVAEGYGDMHTGKAFYDFEYYKLMIERMFLENKIDFLYHTLFAGTITEGDVVKGVVIQNKSGRRTLTADTVIDCTGDGDVCASAGCDFKKGRDSDGKCQPMTLMFTIGGVDFDRVKKWRTSYGMEEVWSLAQKNGDMETFQKKIMGFWWNSKQPTMVGINFTHIIGKDCTRTEDLTDATVEARRQAFHLVPVFRKYVPGMENCFLVSTGSVIGTRESRRITGKYVLTENDLMSEKEFDDSIGYGSFFIDIHSLDEGGMDHNTWYPPKGFKYQIPYRALLPANHENILVGGRCASFTHVSLGSTRVMSQCTLMGEAAGTAAAIAVEAGISPSNIDVKTLQTRLRKAGGIISGGDIRKFAQKPRI